MSLPNKLCLLMPAIALLGAPEAFALLDGGASVGSTVGANVNAGGVTHIGTNSTNTDIGAGAGARSGGNVSGDINSDANSNQNAMVPTASEEELNTTSAKESTDEQVQNAHKKKKHFFRKHKPADQHADTTVESDTNIDTRSEAR